MVAIYRNVIDVIAALKQQFPRADFGMKGLKRLSIFVETSKFRTFKSVDCAIF